MKRKYLNNKDTVSDATILGDLAEMSEGKLKLGEFDLPHEKASATRRAQTRPEQLQKETRKGDTNTWEHLRLPEEKTNGTITPQGAKNETLQILCAVLLTLRKYASLISLTL